MTGHFKCTLRNRLQAALSERHQVVVTAERTVYAWGDNRHGQLGLGDRKFRAEPALVESLTSKCVTKVAVGMTISYTTSALKIRSSTERRFYGVEKTESDIMY